MEGHFQQRSMTEGVFSARIESVPEIREAFSQFLLGLGISDEEKEQWRLVITEIATNAVRHGARFDPDASITVLWWSDDSTIWLEVGDPGSGPSEEAARHPKLPDDPLSEGGRGLFIAHEFSDFWEPSVGLTGGFRLRVGRNYDRLNRALPEDPELEQILDELSNAYESLSLFDQLGKNLISRKKVESFFASSLALFQEANGYDQLHLEWVRQIDGPEIRALSDLEAARTEGSLTKESWSRLREQGSLNWESDEDGVLFVDGRGCVPVGCFASIEVKGEVVGAIGIYAESPEVRFLSGDFSKLRSLADVLGLGLAHAIDEREREAAQMDLRELSIATDLQRELLPLQMERALPGYEILSRRRAARAVAGDFAEVREDPDGALVGCVIDVMGKGVPAALLAGLFRSLFIRYTRSRGSLAPFLAETNEVLLEQLGGRTIFLTAVVFRLSPQSGILTVLNAGHCPALLWQGAEQPIEIEASGPPLGVLPDQSWEPETHQLHPGDRFAVVTDGCYEWRRESDSDGGWNFLVDWMSARREDDGVSMWEALQSEIEAAGVREQALDDDETLLLISRTEDWEI